ncbi:uncharacterized protein LOC135838025 [Planococcus citri]|uniref:uncharacterized protein LOC135838025 n=1 Tax=Planococcus citri TaxID=170843 RepID=UPI0031F925BC
MAKVLANIYDLLYPSPPALQDLAAIAIAAKLWHKRTIEILCDENSSEEDAIEYCYGPEISLRSDFPQLPSTILSIVEGYFDKLRFSDSGGSSENSVEDFLDIVCNFYGTIDNDKLAKLAMSSEEVSDVEKFKIACRFCLEDDIKRIWPSVSDSEDLNLDDDYFHFHSDPLVYYWVHRLRNQLHKTPLSDYGYAIIDGREIQMFNSNWSVVEYFWKSSKVADRKESAAYLLKHRGQIFCRYIFARLTEDELNTLMTERRDSFLCTLLNSNFRAGNSDDSIAGGCILAVWEYIKHKVSERDFICAVREIIKKQTVSLGDIWSDESFSYQFWNRTPDHLKQVAIQDVLLDRSLFVKNTPSCHRNNWLIRSVLADAPFEARSVFWNANWRVVLPGTKMEDLQQFLTLCCETESDIILFKNNNLSKYENVGQFCLEYLKKFSFDELNQYLNFCCVEKETISALQLELLTDYLNFLRGTCPPVNNLTKENNFIHHIHSLCAFIDDVYNDIDLAADFKTQVLLAPRTIELLARYVIENQLEEVMQFVLVDSFAVSEEATNNFKHLLVPSVVNLLSTGESLYFKFDNNGFESFMRWCFGSDDEISAFKRTVPVDEIVRNILNDQRNAQDYNDEEWRELYSDLGKFLEWVCSSPEEIAEFKKKFDGFEEYTK